MKRLSDVKVRNKKAGYLFFLVDTFTAGIVLSGTEIKSIRTGKASINEAYCTFFNDELYVRNMHIAEYGFGNRFNHEPRQQRKLLLTKRELKKLQTKVKEKGFTIIPVLLYINEKGLAKLEISLARGKRLFDKRETLKEKDRRREVE
ncbi:MAG: SsrA-binding protein SmpB [Bacteroidales bacterium]|jgi:SsrA-binding protein|nr:SsrA-binding protein SmpB [Bacteroidales bacterium]